MKKMVVIIGGLSALLLVVYVTIINELFGILLLAGIIVSIVLYLKINLIVLRRRNARTWYDETVSRISELRAQGGFDDRLKTQRIDPVEFVDFCFGLSAYLAAGGVQCELQVTETGEIDSHHFDALMSLFKLMPSTMINGRKITRGMRVYSELCKRCGSDLDLRDADSRTELLAAIGNYMVEHFEIRNDAELPLLILAIVGRGYIAVR